MGQPLPLAWSLLSGKAHCVQAVPGSGPPRAMTGRGGPWPLGPADGSIPPGPISRRNLCPLLGKAPACASGRWRHPRASLRVARVGTDAGGTQGNGGWLPEVGDGSPDGPADPAHPWGCAGSGRLRLVRSPGKARSRPGRLRLRSGHRCGGRTWYLPNSDCTGRCRILAPAISQPVLLWGAQLAQSCGRDHVVRPVENPSLALGSCRSACTAPAPEFG